MIDFDTGQGASEAAVSAAIWSEEQRWPASKVASPGGRERLGPPGGVARSSQIAKDMLLTRALPSDPKRSARPFPYFPDSLYGMKTVRADQEIETPGGGVLKRDLHAVPALIDAGDAIAGDRSAIPFNLAVDIPREIAPGNGHVATLSRLPKISTSNPPIRRPCALTMRSSLML